MGLGVSEGGWSLAGVRGYEGGLGLRDLQRG